VLEPRDARQIFIAAGYEPANVRPNYAFTCRASDGRLINESLSIAAFGALPLNIRTSCLAFDQAESDQTLDVLFQKLRYFAAPLAIVGIGERVGLWSIRGERSPTKLREVAAKDWPASLQSEVVRFSPSVVLAAKSGQLPLDFVDAGLTRWAEKITEQTLVYLLETLLTSSLEYLSRPAKTNVQARLSLIRLVFHLFACRVLEDKGVIPQADDPRRSLVEANQRFSENVDPTVLDSPLLNEAVVQYVHKQLKERFAFASLTTEMLGYAYENALVTSKLRRERGIFYTPRLITNQVLQMLPIESIPQDERVILDPCCGSGSFLLAGFERLGALLPNPWSPARRHQYLRARLIGSDIDEFAIEVAALSLVVTDPENRNGWQLRRQDALALARADLRSRPTVIVTNPPFKELKAEGTRRELASEILIRCIDLLAPGGVLGVVLPQSILDSRAGREGRRTFLETCDLIAIDALPGGLFQSAAETAVLMARKRPLGVRAPSTPVTVRELRAKDLPRFRSTGGYTATYSINPDDWATDPDHAFLISPFASIWHTLARNSPRLAEIARVRSGIRLKPDDISSVSTTKRAGDVPFIDRPDVLRPFALLIAVRGTKWLRHGPHLDRARDTEIFENPKILVNSNRNPGNAWRLIAAPAPAGLYFSENFHAVVPREQASTEVILAVLNSPVANAWFDAHCRKRKVVQSILEELPFPLFSEADADQVRMLVRKMSSVVVARWKSSEEGLFYEGPKETLGSTTLRDRLDELVFRAYGLTAQEARHIQKYMATDKRPG
jgi:methylase of polypeptide subunit release factors